MARRKQLPDIMGEALGRFNLASQAEPEEIAPLITPSVNKPREKTAPKEDGCAARTEALAVKLESMRLSGMAQALRAQLKSAKMERLSFEDRLGLLVEWESRLRAAKRGEQALKKAGIPNGSGLSSLDYHPQRGLSREQVAGLAACDWIERKLNLLICGPCGTGKSFLTTALVRRACELKQRACYKRLPELLRDLALARQNGLYGKMLESHAKYNLLALDDCSLDDLTRREGRDFLDLVDLRHDKGSLILAGVEPLSDWPRRFADPEVGRAVVDRLAHNSINIRLKGESLRATYLGGRSA